MDAGTALRELMTAINEHRWEDLAQYLHDDFVCHLVHTGESFSRDEWIAFNADYPDFDTITIEELVSTDMHAACRSFVSNVGSNGAPQFACASFARMTDGRISSLTEVWTDLDQQAPEGTRPPTS